MALIPCKQCGKSISSTAKKCPHCGTQFAVETLENKNTINSNINKIGNGQSKIACHESTFDVNLVRKSDYVIVGHKKVSDSNGNVILVSKRPFFTLSSDMDIGDSMDNVLFNIKKVSSTGIIFSDTYYDLISTKTNQKIGGYLTSGNTIKILDKNNLELMGITNLNNGAILIRSTIGEKLEFEIIDKHICTVEIYLMNSKVYFTSNADPDIRLLTILLFLFFHK